jgi:hypothetical protein
MIKNKDKYYYHINENLIPYRKESKWGYSDLNANIVIQPNFSHVEFFDEGFAIVGRYFEVDFDLFEERYGLVNEEGNIIIPIQFAEITRSSYGGFMAKNLSRKNKEDPSFKCFDSKGNEFPILQDLKSKNSILVKHFADKYQKVFQFGDDLFITIPISEGQSTKIELQILNSKGEKTQLDQIGLKVGKEVFLQLGFWLGRRKCSKINGKEGFFDNEGILRIPFIYEYLSSFKNDLAIAKLGGKYGIIDLSNNCVVDFKYDKLDVFEKEKFIYRGKQDKQYDLFTIENGNIISFDNIFPELNADFKKIEFITECYDENDNIILTNNNGKVIFSTKYDIDNQVLLYGEIAEVYINEKQTFIDYHGNKLFSKEYDILYFLGSDRFYFENFEDDSAGIINSEEEEIYKINPLFKNDKWILREMYVYDFEVKSFSRNKLNLIEISCKVYPSKSDFVVGYITKDGIECWEGDLNYKSLYKQFREECEHNQYLEQDLTTYESSKKNTDEYLEGPYCPSCGGREYMCCNYWIERNA